MRRLTRRELLERGALLAGGAIASGFVSACSSGQKPDLAKLDAMLEGRVVLPSSPGWDHERLLWNTRFDHVPPRAVVEVAGVEDVRATIRFARDHDLRLIARNGRHSFGGYSTEQNALVVDVSRLDGIDVRSGVATLGAGRTLLSTYQALWPQRMTIPGGTCPTVGVTGLTTGGGIGVLVRNHGLTCDTLVGAELVDAEGRLLRVSEHERPDLFWALRGAGAGSFGIITALEFRLVPADMPFTSVELEFPWNAVTDVLTAWQAWIHAAPRNVGSYVELVTRSPVAGSPAVTLEVIHAGNPEEVEPLVAELVDTVGAKPSHLTSHTSPWVTTLHDAFCKGLRKAECRDAEISRAGKLPRLAFYAKSDVAAKPWDEAGFDALAHWMEKRQRDRVLTPTPFSDTHDVGKIIIEACDGAVNDLAPDATAFVHRGTTRFVSQYQARWRGDNEKANIAWTNALYEAIAPYRSGMAYQDYIDPELTDWERAYYGANLPRLRRVKSKYDPDDFFRFARSVPPG